MKKLILILFSGLIISTIMNLSNSFTVKEISLMDWQFITFICCVLLLTPILKYIFNYYYQKGKVNWILIVLMILIITFIDGLPLFSSSHLEQDMTLSSAFNAVIINILFLIYMVILTGLSSLFFKSFRDEIFETHKKRTPKPIPIIGEIFISILIFNSILLFRNPTLFITVIIAYVSSLAMVHEIKLESKLTS